MKHEPGLQNAMRLRTFNATADLSKLAKTLLPLLSSVFSRNCPKKMCSRKTCWALRLVILSGMMSSLQFFVVERWVVAKPVAASTCRCFLPRTFFSRTSFGSSCFSSLFPYDQLRRQSQQISNGMTGGLRAICVLPHTSHHGLRPRHSSLFGYGLRWPWPGVTQEWCRCRMDATPEKQSVRNRLISNLFQFSKHHGPKTPSSSNVCCW